MDRLRIFFRRRLTDLHQDYLVFSCETQVDANSVADPDSGSAMNISEKFFETVFRVKILKFFDADPNLPNVHSYPHFQWQSSWNASRRSTRSCTSSPSSTRSCRAVSAYPPSSGAARKVTPFFCVRLFPVDSHSFFWPFPTVLIFLSPIRRKFIYFGMKGKSHGINVFLLLF